MTIRTKITAGLSAAAMFSAIAAPAAFAATTVDISGNGAGSKNTVELTGSNSDKLVQKNSTTVVTSIVAKSNTGGNKANGNTNGDVTISTGDATTEVAVMVGGGSNDATLPDCGCTPEDLDVTISGNGKDSDNKVKKSDTNTKTTKQKNKASVTTAVTAKAKTGKNKANNNTGPGIVDVTTGESNTSVGVQVDGATNTLN